MVSTQVHFNQNPGYLFSGGLASRIDALINILIKIHVLAVLWDHFVNALLE